MSTKPPWLPALVFIAALLLLASSACQPEQHAGVPDAVSPNANATSPPSSIERERQRLDATVWISEVEAQKYERPFVRLWDLLRAATDKGAVLAEFPFETLVLGQLGSPGRRDHGVEILTTSGEDVTQFNPQSWRKWLAQRKSAGWKLIESEWHHAEFEPSDDAPRSVVSIRLHVANSDSGDRYIVRGDLQVQWSPQADPAGSLVAHHIDASRLQLTRRAGEPLFVEAAAIPLDGPYALGPMIAGDLDNDGLSELLFPTLNRVLWNRGNWVFEQGQLLAHPPKGRIGAAVLADFTGDGTADLVAACLRNDILLFAADASRRFSTPPVRLGVDPRSLEEPMAATAGDIDADGDLDLFVGQHKLPYMAGQMPTPYYDANDGLPCYLFENQGGGSFRDITSRAGLNEKRFRRTYSASFVDLDGDSDLDLLVASDFAGLDVYRNEGGGKFTDVTEQLVDQRHAFGMALSFGDYNMDGQLDFTMIGMSSTTARRLDQLGLGREDFPQHQQLRNAMGYGNRMYLASGSHFRQAPFNDQIARTGWSWGTTSPDIDNDGDRDLYVVNGHLSGKTAQDYCTRFWCHDIYTGSSKHDKQLSQLLKLTLAKELSPISWNGYEHNVLLLNEGGDAFISIGFLAGVASELDSRNSLSDDLDGDGRVDLVFTGKQLGSHPTVYLLRNQIEKSGHWIALEFADQPHGGLGARVVVKTPQRTHVAAVVAGDSLQSQHAPTVHVGLGGETQVSEITVQWPDGRTVRLENPAIDQVHRLRTVTGVPSSTILQSEASPVLNE
ncbi:MAG: CRTAC1 family protein [Pirellulales bacterium]|nr:CRTAC1 family protein [Pirellulales bacterium]